MGEEPLSRLRAICLALPEATERLTWGNVPTFRVRGKIFALYEVNERLERIGVWCKAPPGLQEGLIGADPGRFYAPPYLGGAGWIGVRFDVPTDWAEVAGLVEESFLLVAPKRLAVGLGRA
jgi:predicted DNA-binding protein (MmcQ/YjbR family)